MPTNHKNENENENEYPAYLVLTRQGTAVACVVGIPLFLAGLIFLPGTGGSDYGRAWWLGVVCAGIGWACGHASDAVMGRGWWSTGAREARAKNPAWMGDEGAKRRRLIAILVVLAVVFVAVLTAFKFAR